jgi:glucosamine--fructose-6-phosphate aminotransferase (isomerizing)
MDDSQDPYAERLRALRAEPSRDVAGDPARLRRIGFTRAEMASQGAAICTTLDAEAPALSALAARIRDCGFDHIAIAGCGDSWFVGMGVRHALETLTGRPCLAVQALDFAGYDHVGTGPGGLVIGLSAGGNTPAVMAALRMARARGAMTVGLSNTAGSAILAEFDGGLQVHATRRGWPTQSSTAAMALLVKLGLALAPASPQHAQIAAALAGAPALADATLAQCDVAAAQAAHAVADATTVFFAGAGPHYATACFGAAKLRELSPVHSAAFPLEELHHYRLPKAGDALFVVAPDAASRERALDTALVGAAEGARIYALLSAPDREIEARVEGTIRLPPVAAALAPVVHAPALQALAYHFAMARDAAGLGYPGMRVEVRR